MALFLGTGFGGTGGGLDPGEEKTDGPEIWALGASTPGARGDFAGGLPSPSTVAFNTFESSQSPNDELTLAEYRFMCLGNRLLGPPFPLLSGGAISLRGTDIPKSSHNIFRRASRTN